MFILHRVGNSLSSESKNESNNNMTFIVKRLQFGPIIFESSQLRTLQHQQRPEELNIPTYLQQAFCLKWF